MKTVAGSYLKQSSGSRNSGPSIEDDEDDDDMPVLDPLSALVKKNENLDVSKLPSVRPADSLAILPPKLTSSQSVLFLAVDKPSVITLKNVVDRRGDRFRITPHKEAVIIECPAGGYFVEYDRSKQKVIEKPSKKPQPAELRCVGDEEVAEFQARGVGTLTVGWRKKGKDKTTTGVIEGIEEDITALTTQEQAAVFRRDRVSRTHTVPLRIQHDKPGLHTISLTSITDSLHNTYTPSGHSAEKVYNVIPRPSARFDCSTPKQVLQGKSTTLPILLDGLSGEPIEIVYTFQSLKGDITTESLKVTRKVESITVSEPGTYTLLEIRGPCSGSILEVSSCPVELIPPPTLKMDVQTLHEW